MPGKMEASNQMKWAAILSFLLVSMATSSVLACDVRESYIARLGAADHFNSSGVRLRSAAAIIRQDRANFHQFGKRDPEDDDDRFFASTENRALLERMLATGDSSPSVLADIINGTPLILVRVCRSARGDYVIVSVAR